jgi:hypothetical protein
MTLTSEMITLAYRESNLIAIGVTPSAAQVAEALARLNSIVSGVYGYEVGQEFIDWPVGQEGINTEESAPFWTSDLWAYPPINMRLIAASNVAQTIYLPPGPSNGSRIALIDPGQRLAAAPITIDGNGRYIEGTATQVENTDGINKIWLYRADTGSWTLLSELTGVDPEQFPFPIEFDDYFITKLAMRLNPRYGRQMAEASAVVMAMTLDKLRARYRQDEKVVGPIGAFALTQGFGSGRAYSQFGDVGYRRGTRNIRPPHYQG